MGTKIVPGYLVGGASALGYVSQFFLEDCYGAGIEMAGSGFMAYSYYSGGYTLTEKVLVPIPDLVQIFS